MSGVEIERKFLVRKGDAYKRVAFSCTHIQQGYIPAEGATVRVRVRDDHAYPVSYTHLTLPTIYSV